MKSLQLSSWLDYPHKFVLYWKGPKFEFDRKF